MCDSKPLVLEAGKCYRNRAGATRQIVELVDHAMGSNTKVARDNYGQYYFLNGRMHDHTTMPSDLVSEVPPAKLQPIPHADLIRAVLDGKVVQRKHKDSSTPKWDDFDTPVQSIGTLIAGERAFEYRLKPSTVVRWLPVSKGGMFGGQHTTGIGPAQCTKAKAASFPWHVAVDRVLRIELDPDTLEVISAKTEAP